MLLLHSFLKLMGNTGIGIGIVKSPLRIVYSVLFHWVEGGWKENCNMMLLEHFSLPLLHILNAF